MLQLMPFRGLSPILNLTILGYLETNHSLLLSSCSLNIASISSTQYLSISDHKMAHIATNRTQSPAGKTPHTLVDVASVDQGSDGKVDIKEEREFV